MSDYLAAYETEMREKRQAAQAKALLDETEWERRKAAERARDAERKLREEHQRGNQERSDWMDQVDDLQHALGQTQEELTLARQFLTHKGLLAEFDDWASFRRSE